MAYRKINPLLWDDEWFVGLDDFDRAVWWGILSGPQVRSIPGLMVATAVTLADFMRRPTDAVSAALARFAKAGKVELDERARLLRVVNAPRWAAEHGEPENPNVIKGWWRAWRELPDCETKRRHLTGLREAFVKARERAVGAPVSKAQQEHAEAIRAERADGWNNAWAATFGTVPEPAAVMTPATAEPFRDGSGTVSEPFRNGSGNPLTCARAFQEQEQRQEPIQEQEQEPSRASARATPTPTSTSSPDDRVSALVCALRRSRDLLAMEKSRQVDLHRCAQDLLSDGDNYVMGGRLRMDEVDERLLAAIGDLSQAVAAAASTSQPMAPKEATRKLLKFASTSLGKSRDEWGRARASPTNGRRPSGPGAPNPAQAAFAPLRPNEKAWSPDDQ